MEMKVGTLKSRSRGTGSQVHCAASGCCNGSKESSRRAWSWEGWPVLKPAAADPGGTFPAAASEAGKGDEGDDEGMPALKAANADLRGSFTLVTAEAGMATPGVAGEEMMAGGQDMVSATTLLIPATCQMSEVYSASYDS